MDDDSDASMASSVASSTRGGKGKGKKAPVKKTVAKSTASKGKQTKLVRLLLSLSGVCFSC